MKTNTIHKPLTITLNQIKVAKPCMSGWAKLLKSISKTTADDTPLTYAQILKSNGIDDALWVLFSAAPKSHSVAFMHSFHIAYTKNSQPKNIGEVVINNAILRHIHGIINQQQLDDYYHAYYHSYYYSYYHAYYYSYYHSDDYYYYHHYSYYHSDYSTLAIESI